MRFSVWRLLLLSYLRFWFGCETAVYSERRWVMIKGGGYSGKTGDLKSAPSAASLTQGKDAMLR